MIQWRVVWLTNEEDPAKIWRRSGEDESSRNAGAILAKVSESFRKIPKISGLNFENERDVCFGRNSKQNEMKFK